MQVSDNSYSCNKPCLIGANPPSPRMSLWKQRFVIFAVQDFPVGLYKN